MGECVEHDPFGGAPRGRREGRKRRERRISPRFGSEYLLVIGNLKSGKSTLFSWLISGRSHTLVEPDSCVELNVGRLQTKRFTHLLDAPGCYSLLDRSEDAQVVRNLMARRRVGGALLVLDAKNLRRGLPLALQLAEFGLPTVVALNMVDEARLRGIGVDVDALQKELGVPVIATDAVEGHGLGQLRRTLKDAQPITARVAFDGPLNGVLADVAGELDGNPFCARGVALLLTAGVPQAVEVLDDHTQPETTERVRALVRSLHREGGRPPSVLVAEHFQRQAALITARVQDEQEPVRAGWLQRLGVWTRKPLTGIPIAVLVLTMLYLFVGWLGAMVLVDLLEGRLFGQVVLPLLEGWFQGLSQSQHWFSELMIGQFGLITVGIVLPLGIVLPVLATFFFAYGLLEDSGYLPRMSLLVDRSLRRIGLNGKGLLPLVMGFSCVTMAVLTTRVLDTRKQRIIATLLLMLAIPCAPLLGVMMVILGKVSFSATVVLFGLVFLQFVFVGLAVNHVMPRGKQDFILELTPLRVPGLRNSLLKTGHRLFWFLREAIPYFLIGTFVLYLFDQLGWIEGMRDSMRPVLEHFVGLPVQSADIFLMSLVRREAGAALLLQQVEGGTYDSVQVVVTLLVMTLLIPCINSLLVMYKERGVVVSSAILVFILTYALSFGALTNWVLRALGVQF